VDHWATFYHAAEVVLALVVIALAAPRIRHLLYRAPLETKAFHAELRKTLESDRSRALALAKSAGEAWVGRAAVFAFEHGSNDREVHAFLDDLAHESQRGLTVLRMLGRFASAAGVLGAVIAILWMLEGDHGLLRLAAGRVEAIALNDAIVSVALGVAISMFAITVRRMLTLQGTRLLKDAERTVEIVRASAEREPGPAPVV
jgi:hypothetical protein